MRPLLAVLAIVLMAVAIPNRDVAETASFGGYLVADATGEPIARQRITFTGPTTRAAVTDANGLFAIPHLEPGMYAVSVAERTIPVEVVDGANVRDLRL